MTACWEVIRSDVHRVAGDSSVRHVLRALATNPPSRFLAVYRLGRWARVERRRRRVLCLATSALYRWASVRYRIEIPFAVESGPGLKLDHRVGGVIVNSAAVLGSNVTLTPGVVVGNNDGRSGAPTIGSDVILHVGSKVIGAVTIGDRVQVGANSVVIRDVPSDSVVAGVPARKIEGRTPVQVRNAVDG